MSSLERSRTFGAAVSSPPFWSWTLSRHPFRRGDTSLPSISSRGHFVAIHFVTGTLRRLPFRRWDALSLEHEQGCGIRLSLKTTWQTVRKLYLNLDLRSPVQCVSIITMNDNESYKFMIFMHLYLYIATFINNNKIYVYDLYAIVFTYGQWKSPEYEKTWYDDVHVHTEICILV